MLAEARRVVDEQIQELDRTDKKAARSLQGMIVLFGIAVSAQEVLNPKPVWSSFVYFLLGTGTGAWCGALLLLLLAYSSSDGRLGAVSTMRNHSELESVSADAVRARLLHEYSLAIKQNSSMISINSRAVIGGQILVIIGTAAFGGMLLLWL